MVQGVKSQQKMEKQGMSRSADPAVVVVVDKLNQMGVRQGKQGQKWMNRGVGAVVVVNVVVEGLEGMENRIIL